MSVILHSKCIEFIIFRVINKIIGLFLLFLNDKGEALSLGTLKVCISPFIAVFCA
jgi:hypothetical protein